MLTNFCLCHRLFPFLFVHNCMHIGAHYRSHSTWDPRRHLYEELRSRRGSNETVHTHRGKEILEASRNPRINMYNMALTMLPSV